VLVFIHLGRKAFAYDPEKRIRGRSPSIWLIDR
jgi:hypothetical protein